MWSCATAVRLSAMDQVRVESRIDEAVTAFGVTGRGVLVAILDRAQWGYGKLDAYSALALVAASIPGFSANLVSTQSPQIAISPTIVGSKYILEFSTNLTTWIRLSTNIATTNMVLLQDITEPAQTRFYRAARSF